jgi:DNA-binding NarL/FixJ family response regulator
MIKVFIYDDNASRRESLGMLLDSYPNISVTGNFPNCLNIIEQITKLQPDVILMDIQMPGISGIEAVKQTSKLFPNIKIIMQTVFEDEEKIFDALRFGAGGYLLKKDNPEKIVSAIEDIMQGGAPMTPVIANKVLQFF